MPEINDLTNGQRARLDLRNALRERMIEVWNMRSRDIIEWPTDMHVDEILNLAVMPTIDGAISGW